MVHPYLVSSSPSSHGLLHREDEGSVFLHDVGNYLPLYCMEHATIQGGVEIPDSFLITYERKVHFMTGKNNAAKKYTPLLND
jgi:hypothetical protein